MNIFLLVILAIGTTIGTIFNYFLNRAPGSEPEDYQIGPPAFNISCDCAFIPLIISGIAVLIIATSPRVFANRNEMYITGLVVFFIITMAGFIGRRRRHQEWKELQDIFERAVVMPHIQMELEEFDDMLHRDDDDDMDYY